ncbi:MAG TPA: shikimate dehydrogenase [Terriglobales bacterium]|nr:shikimate dehydrogenase [Terriglobales bacterium]
MAASPTNRILPLRLPRVCIAIVGASAAEMVEKAEAVARENPLLEFRLDYLKQPASGLATIRRLLQSRSDVVAIGTCRRAANGGRFRGSLEAQIDILVKAGESGCQLVDLELQSASSIKLTDFNRLRSKAAVVLSFHDFRATRKLDETFRKMRAFPADFYKIVTTATNLQDNVTMMKFLEEQSAHHSMVGLCMGEQGTISRVLGVRAGSVFTFAALGEGEETAPGQITARALRDVFRIDQVDAATKVYGVAGDPVEHSLSPLMMNAAFRRENVNAVYLALHAKELDDLVQCIRQIPIHGVSITMPYKEEVLEYLDNTDSLTSKVGACNTVVRAHDGKLYGFNTDIAGVLRPLEQRINIPGARVLVLGAGGAARAAVFGLKERGAEVSILNRTTSVARKLARKARAKVIKRSDLKKLQFDVIINATPVGMGSPKTSPLKENEIRCRYLLDMVYVPMETRLMKLARSKGVQVISGAEMFTQQGARQFEIWTGKPAPVADMQYVVQTALSAAEKAEGGGKSGRKKSKK